MRTPCDYSPRISPIIGSSLYLKKEHLSITGSYKERGALNKLLQLTPEERAARAGLASRQLTIR